MRVFKHEGKTYEAISELNSCKGCAFDDNDKGCFDAGQHYDCAMHKVIWLYKGTSEVASNSADKNIISTFEQKLQELLTEEYSLSNRRVCSIFANEHTLSGKPLALKIEYETNL
jgi:hypothetical protein